MNARITIKNRQHARRPWVAFVDGKSVLTFGSLADARGWVADCGSIELLRTDLAREFERRGASLLTVSNIAWTCPDEWVQAAAWLAEKHPEASPSMITSAVFTIAAELDRTNNLHD